MVKRVLSIGTLLGDESDEGKRIVCKICVVC